MTSTYTRSLINSRLAKLKAELNPLNEAIERQNTLIEQAQSAKQTLILQRQQLIDEAQSLKADLNAKAITNVTD